MSKEADESRLLSADWTPTGQLSMLLEEVQRDYALKRATKGNPSFFRDERIQRLSDVWFSQRTTATVEQKDRVGLAYISSILGLGDDIAERFVAGDRQVYHAVGMKQSGMPYNTNTSKFWKEVQAIFPETYRDEDMVFLVGSKDVVAVLHFLWQLEVPLAWESPVLRRLAHNAHVYK